MNMSQKTPVGITKKPAKSHAKTQPSEKVEYTRHGISLRGARLTRAILIKEKRLENRTFSMPAGW